MTEKNQQSKRRNLPEEVGTCGEIATVVLDVVLQVLDVA